jgi:indole-3-pyruvate monooxygenase
MKETNTLIIGASIAGLASAGSLTKAGIDYMIIEKSNQVATPWRNHYERLHLHTNKKLSNLPHKKFAASVPRYPSRQEVVDYLDDYKQAFDIKPIFNTEAKSVKKEGDTWIIDTTNGCYKAKNVIIATGPYGKPRAVQFKGMDTFNGVITHSAGYKSGRDFKGKKVLVVGFGNSACEIAIDLHEQGAYPGMAVRSAVNVLPRDIFGIPILQLGLLTSALPPRFADKMNAPLFKFLLGDIRKLGLKKLPYGPLEQIEKHQSVPLLDIGTLQLIKEGHIQIFSDIDYIEGNTIHFVDGKKDNFDVIVAAIGYDKGYEGNFIQVDKSRFEDLSRSVDKQKYFGKDGLYFCGFWVSPTGQIREISLDAQKIAKHIALFLSCILLLVNYHGPCCFT